MRSAFTPLKSKCSKIDQPSFYSSSIPTQYVSHLENDCSGDVVIVVPSMDNLNENVRSQDTHSHHICIDPEGEMEPNSPKTITESSSKFNCFALLTVFFFVIIFRFHSPMISPHSLTFDSLYIFHLLIRSNQYIYCWQLRRNVGRERASEFMSLINLSFFLPTHFPPHSY